MSFYVSPYHGSKDEPPSSGSLPEFPQMAGPENTVPPESRAIREQEYCKGETCYCTSF